jgi:hypothetical protein
LQLGEAFATPSPGDKGPEAAKKVEEKMSPNSVTIVLGHRPGNPGSGPDANFRRPNKGMTENKKPAYPPGFFFF